MGLKRTLQHHFLLFFGVSLFACNQQALEPIVLPDHQIISCGDFAKHVTPFGVLNNNVWNKQAAGSSVHQQCIIKRTTDRLDQFGWSWDWPTTTKAVFGQPQIKIGSSPWEPESRFGDDLPIKVVELKSLPLAQELEVISNGNLNVVTTMWLTEGLQPTKESIVAEFMIWTYYTKDQFKPGGRKLETVTLDGLEWEFWEQENWQDVSGKNKNNWRYIAFRLTQPRLAIEFDASRLIDYAVHRKSIDNQWFISDLELGTEVMGGRGLAWLKRFDVQIRR